jgi:predicted nucleotidyltransferase
MKQELIKPIIRVGNSAGVLLPREWLNGRARIELVEKPIEIKKDILEILSSYLEDVIGIYLVGSYARGEQTKDSDVDVLAITNRTNKRIIQNKYEIILISKDVLEKQIENNAFPLIPMLKEAKSIINSDLLACYQQIKLTQKNLKYHIETTKSAMNLAKEFLSLGEDLKENISDKIMYSLILRLREAYILDCLKKNKSVSKKEFLVLIKRLTGSIGSYEAYVRSKNKEKDFKDISTDNAKKIYNYVLKKIEEHERWIKTKGNK